MNALKVRNDNKEEMSVTSLMLDFVDSILPLTECRYACHFRQTALEQTLRLQLMIIQVFV